MTTHKHIYMIAIGLITAALLLSSPALARSSLDGAITVSNTRHSAVSLKIDGESMGVVFPGKRRVLHNIPNGVRLLVISGKHGPPVTRRVSVPIDGRASIQVARRLGSTRILNDSSVRMRINVDGRFAGMLAPGDSLVRRRMRPGRHTIEATPSSARLATSGRITKSIRVRAGARTKVALGQFLSRVKVTNSNSRRVSVHVDGTYTQRLASGHSLVLRDLSPGVHRIEMKRRGRTLSTTTIRLGLGTTAYWKPEAAHRGRVRVANRSRRDISVSIDGRRSEHVAAGESATVRNLRPGVHDIKITRARGRVEHRRVRVPRSNEAVVTVLTPSRRHAHRPAGSVYVATR